MVIAIKVLLIAYIMKGLTLGSDCNLYYLLRYRDRYLDIYVRNRREMNEKIKKELKELE